MLMTRGGRDRGSLPDPEPDPGEEVLRFEHLSVTFGQGGGQTHAVRGVSLGLRAGQVVGVAGESGSGKTTLALAAMGLLGRGAAVGGSIKYRDAELIGLSERRLRPYRGRHLAMIFQETATALNPVIRVGDQLMMTARTHLSGTAGEVRERVSAALADVRLTDPDRVMASYPHELSGGMCQRIIIAMALSCGSRVLFADEPTTALDVSVQEEILQLLRTLMAQRQLAVMLISHDLAVLAEICDDLAVMYKGQVVETGRAAAVLSSPAHPYTRALLDCLPRLYGPKVTLPELSLYPTGQAGLAGQGGCRFRPRCSRAAAQCAQEPELAPAGTGGGRLARCWRADEVLADGAPDADTQGSPASA